ncbi:MAG: FAD-binding oxidoreductase [Alphaproteobacteria bacterium]|jgi:sarcosine oxidase|nr:FAD-dependent oxidoreductase [Rhodospirillaceae bacterium]MDP6406886.1 FAD-binding oxidoreductase [Alphaproteobacteria bacterium]MDP6624014.1 FAD-binding oxidoreductase [Alphaproteobacteria bacterium]|tara:strand:+ start:212 stop:1399 length:1188 start_codon:yes stop_codon:yes gene_type:complete
MSEKPDVLVIGGGVIGSAVAYFLAAEPAFDGRVTVVERDPTYATSSTALSVASIRQQFSTPENIRMSLFGAEFFRSAGQYLAIDGEAPDIAFRESGYLFLATEESLPILESNHHTQLDCGAAVALLTPAELRMRFPWLAVDDLAAGSLGLANEGWLDSYALLQAFKQKAISLGVRYLRDEVVGLARQGNRLVAAELASGDRLEFGLAVNAAGPRANRLAAMAGLDLPVRARKRIVHVIDCPQPIADCPLVIDPTGLYFRPEGRNFLSGISPAPDQDPDQDPDSDGLELANDLFETIWPLLARRVPAFETLKLVRAWAGHYAYNTLDQNAILGPHPEVENLYFTNGFSGHGLQQSPAVGRAMSELITFGSYRTLDLSRFGYERIIENKPVPELNVV